MMTARLALHSWFGFGVAVLVLAGSLSSAADEFTEMPADLPVGEIKSVTRDWHPYACGMSARTRVICAIEAFLACSTFERRELCERVGLYPSRVPQHEYDIFGEGSFELFPPTPAVQQYRLLEFRGLDAQYSPPLLVIHFESRTCYRSGPPPDCDLWWPRYAIISHLDTTEPDIAEWGTLVPPP
jgi:hypothetical protein